MQQYDVLVVGAGMVADEAARAYRDAGGTGTIGILGAEPVPPFPRPALSKKLWTDPDFTESGLDPHTAGETGAELHLSTRVTGVDTDARTVTTERGETFGYGRLLVATGGLPRTLPGLPASERVLAYRTLTDYHALRRLATDGARVVVVGGGYIGTEIAAALSEQDCRTTLVFPGTTLGEERFPEPIASRLHGLFVDAGVEVVAGRSVEHGSQAGEVVTLTLDDGSTLEADVVVTGLGIEPATDFLDGVVDLADDGGVVVDEHLRTSAPDVYAAGDVASYLDPVLGRRRVEHVDQAQQSGQTVGRVLAGSDETYGHTPMFYSDLLGHGYEAVGRTETSLETVVDDRSARGSDGSVVYYLTDDEVVGVLLWDAFDVEDGVERATALLAEHDRPEDAGALVGRIG